MGRKTGVARLRRPEIIQTASEVFLRYGYARTTMRDIAEASGLSRPALYNSFPGKDEVFAAVVETLSEQSLAEMRAALPELATLESKLHFCCERWGAHGFDLVEDHPDANDLFDLSFSPVRKMYADFEGLLAEIIADHVKAPELDASPEDLARNLTFSMRGLKDTARDGNHMRRMISLQVDVFVAALE